MDLSIRIDEWIYPFASLLPGRVSEVVDGLVSRGCSFFVVVMGGCLFLVVLSGGLRILA